MLKIGWQPLQGISHYEKPPGFLYGGNKDLYVAQKRNHCCVSFGALTVTLVQTAILQVQ